MSKVEVLVSPQVLEQISRVWESQTAEFDYDLEVVEGSIPDELQGTLYRNGPGAMEIQGTPLVHPIDGDGMICSIQFNEGKAHFRSHYVNTEIRQVEKKQQKLVGKCLMGTKAPSTWSESIMEWSSDLLAGRLPNTRYKNPSNTNVFYWGGKLLSCWELGHPYLLNPRTLETIGKETLGGILAGNMGAHFRYDAAKDRLVVFSLKVPLSDESPLLTLYEFDREWNIIQKSQFSLDGFYYCHDFMMTENYYIVHQTPFVNPSKREIAQIVSGWAAPGQLMGLKEGQPSRILLIPRYPELSREVKAFDIFPCHVYHHINAYEEGSSVYFASVCIGEKMRMEFEDKVWLSNTSEAPGHVFEFHIELDKSRISWKRTDDCSCEFPTSHPDLNGKSWRYAYLMAAEVGFRGSPYQEIIKYDRELQGRQVWSAREEKGVIMEPIFVPRQGVNLAEDDGWVITQVYHYESHQSQFVVLDAKDLSKGPIARLALSHHTPFGFHGTFTHEIY